MFSKIVTIVAISLSTLCAGELSPNGYRSPTNQAMSSMHFHREDVPVNYKYSAIHQSSPKPTDGYRAHLKYHSSSADPINFRSIQYAPLLRPGELRFQNGMYSKVSLHSPHDLINPTSMTKDQTSTKRDRKPLEPRLESSQPTVVNPHSLSHLEYIPGHNIEVLRSVNRSPGHNAVYRSYTDGNSQADKQKKINYLNQYIIYQPNPLDVEVITKNQQKWPSSSTDSTTTTVITTTPTTFRPSKKPYIPNQYYAQKSNPYRMKEMTKPQQKAPYTKMHALLLNVARAYNMALAPHKSLHTVKENASQRIMNAPGSRQLPAPLSDQKTLMYPVQKNRHFAIHS